MSAIVERIIAARDTLKARSHDFYSREVLDAMADAANAITQRDEEAHYLRACVEKLAEALTFYATAEAHEVDSDRGSIASKALKIGDL